MTTPQSIEHKRYRNVALGFAGVLAMTAAACGTTSPMPGIGPSSLSAAAASAAPNTATFTALKDGKGKDHPGKPDPGPAPTTPTTPPAGTVPTVPDADDSGDSDDAGHGGIQIEGTATKVTGTCPTLAIVVNGQTVTTALATEFQRASCAQIETGQRLHIAGSMQAGSFVAAYVRMQGQTPGDDHGDIGDDDSDDGTVPPPTPGTPPSTGTTPKSHL